MLSRYETIRRRAAVTLAAAALCWSGLPALGDPPAHPRTNDYPTYARVQYVVQCMSQGNGTQALLYQCSCVIDHIAQHLTYDQFVEASTFAHYAKLPGENNGIFRDPDQAKQQSKLYHQVETQSYRACGLKAPAS